MKRNNTHMKKIFIALIILTASSNSFGIVFGGSNLGFLGYEEHTCSAPYSTPTKPYSFDSQWEIDNYNRKVEQYNNELEEFVDCIKQYVENANNDIKRIREAIDEAIDEANSL